MTDTREKIAYDHVRRPVADLVPYARNARLHSDAQISQLSGAIREFGFTNPVLIDENDTIIAGHGRVLAAKKLKMADVPCIIVSGLTDTQRRALVIADNQLSLKASWDQDLLVMELGDLASSGFDLNLAGFDPGDLSALLNGTDLGTEGLTDPDDTPAVPIDAVTTPGDVWILGKHRLVCGDSTDADVVSRALNGVNPHLMVTDPPYGVEYDPEWRNKRLRPDGTPIAGRAIGKVQNDSRVDWREAWALFPGDVAYVWCASLHNHEVAESLLASGFALRSLIIWAKSNFAISRADYHWQHEPCWYVVRDGRTGHWAGDRKQTTLWQIQKPAKSETGHSTQKPVECMLRPIQNNSSPGQAIYEPFSGSGTTIIACEMSGRSCHAIELSPEYVDVAVKRWQNFTGQQAILEGTDSTFDDVSVERPH